MASKYQILVDAQINTADIEKQLKNLHPQLNVDTGSAREDMQEIADSAAEMVLSYQAANQVLRITVDLISDMAEQVYAMDAALVEFKKVSDLRGGALSDYVSGLSEVRETVARTTSDLIEGATEFRKSGFNDSDAASLALIAAQMQNVADEAISTGDAANFLISQMRAFNLEAADAQHLVDGVNEVANNFAVSSSDLTRSLPIVASALAVGNNSWEEMIGLMTGIVEVTRNANRASRGLISIQSRLNQIVDESSSTGKALSAWYKEHNIEIFDQTGQLMSLYDILSQVAEIWDTLSTNEKDYYLNQQAGANQSVQLASALSNFNTVLNATATAYDSMGSAARENQAVVDSLQGKLTTLQAAFQDLANSVIDSKLISGLLTIATTVIKLIDKLPDAVVQMGLLYGVITPIVHLAPHFIGFLTPLAGLFTGATAAAGGFVGVLGAIAPILIIALPLISELVLYISNLNPPLEEVTARINEATEQLKTNKERLDEINKIDWKERTPEIEAERKALEEENEALQEQINKQEELRRRRQEDRESYVGSGELAVKIGRNVNISDTAQGRTISYENALGNTIKETIRIEELIRQAGKLKIGLDEALELETNRVLETFDATVRLTGNDLDKYLVRRLSAVNGALTLGTDLTQEQEEEWGNALPTIKATAEEYEDCANNGYVLNDTQKLLIESWHSYCDSTQQATEDTAEFAEETIEVSNDLGILETAFDELENSSTLTYGTLEELEKLYPNLSAKILDANGNLSEQGEILLKDKSAFVDLIGQEIIFNNTELSVKDKATKLFMLAQAAGVAGESMVLLSNAMKGDTRAGQALVAKYGSLKLDDYLKDYIVPSVKSTQKIAKASSSRSNSSSSSSTKDPILEAKKEAVNLAKAELEILKNSNASYDLQIAKMRDIQNALHDQADYMRKTTGETSEVKELSAEWLDYQNKINDALEDYNNDILSKTKQAYQDMLDVVNKQIAAYEELFDAKDKEYEDEINALKQQREELEKQQEALEAQVTLEEKLDALAKARQQKELVYKDGRFQYINDVDAVSSAAGDLSTFKQEQAYQAQLDAFDAQIDELEVAREALSAQVEAAKTLTNIEDALKTIGIDVNSAWSDNGKFDGYIAEYAALQGKANEYSQSIDSITDIINDKMDRNAIIQQMIANSVAWGSADSEGRMLLHAANQILGAQAGLTFRNGSWYDAEGNLAYSVPSVSQQVATTTTTNTPTQQTAPTSGNSGNNSGGGSTYYSQDDEEPTHSPYTSEDGSWTVTTDKAKDFIDNAKAGDTMIGGDGSVWIANADGTVTATTPNGKVYTYGAYARGTNFAQGGLSLVGEHGAELRVLNQGDGILPADITKNLWDWGKMNPVNFFKGNNDKIQNISIGNISLPSVVDGQGFVKYMRDNFFSSAVRAMA